MALEWKENPQLAWELLRIIDKDLEIDKPLPHITELIYCLTKGYWERTSPLPREPKTTCMFAIGVGLAEVMLKGLRQEIPGELDGIHSSVDLLMPDGRMGEFKTTRYAVGKPPEQWSTGWHKQLLAYMKVRGTTEAVYAVMYVIPAEFKTFEVTATQQDVDDNWTYLQARKVQYMTYMDRVAPGGEKSAPTMPTPFAYRDSNWECKGCQYLTLCEAANMMAEQAHDDMEAESPAAEHEQNIATLDGIAGRE